MVNVPIVRITWVWRKPGCVKVENSLNWPGLRQAASVSGNTRKASMPKLGVVIVLSLLPFSLFSQNSLDGIYEGVLPKYWTLENGKEVLWKDDEHPKHFWYSLISIKIKGDSLFWDDSPVSIYKKDTLYSASDGGFHYYRGTFLETDSGLTLNFRELFCDYCGIPRKKDSTGKLALVTREKSFFAKIVEAGLIINGMLFKKTKKTFKLRSEDPPPSFWK